MTTALEKCLLCESEDCVQTATVPPGYHVWHCSSCGFDWIDRKDIEELVSPELYQNYGYNQGIHDSFERMRATYLAGFRDRVLAYFPAEDIGNLEFLDIGCANGEYLATALELGMASVAGVEIDQTAANHARTYGTVVESTEQFDTQFDIVQIKNVLTNIPDFQSFLTDCLRCLKPDGMLFIDVLNHAGLTSMVRKARHRLGSQKPRYGSLRPPNVINGFSEGNLLMLLEAHDLQPLRIRRDYLGSKNVPYDNARAVKLVGMVGHAIGRGTMLIADARNGQAV